jgi:NAD(P)H-hydrate epimerase
LLTPHTGELARLLGTTAAEIDADRLGAARLAAARTGCCVLLKGPGSVIASPTGRTFLNPTGTPALAQGGTGDVLTGILGALFAHDAARSRGRDDAEVAAAGAWLHGRAGLLAASRVWPHPAGASLLIETLPSVLHEVGG